MRIFAIGDMHLGQGVNKAMDVFGKNWDAHADHIACNWRNVVTNDDLILIPGDISWAMTLAEAQPDLAFIDALPGKKVMIRGNHDYWWNGISKVRNALPESILAIQNDAISFANHVTICGTRGWVLPSHPKYNHVEDESIYLREIGRLKLSLEAAKKISTEKLIVMMHYPPLSVEGVSTPFTELLELYKVDLCIYGHLHGGAIRYGFNGEKNDVRYLLTSCDALAFQPIEIT